MGLIRYSEIRKRLGKRIFDVKNINKSGSILIFGLGMIIRVFPVFTYYRGVFIPGFVFLQNVLNRTQQSFEGRPLQKQ